MTLLVFPSPAFQPHQLLSFLPDKILSCLRVFARTIFTSQFGILFIFLAPHFMSCSSQFSTLRLNITSKISFLATLSKVGSSIILYPSFQFPSEQFPQFYLFTSFCPLFILEMLGQEGQELLSPAPSTMAQHVTNNIYLVNLCLPGTLNIVPSWPLNKEIKMLNK